VTTKRPPAPGRDRDAVSRFIEEFATLLVEAGMPRMPSRVFGALLCSDSGLMTAAELGEVLRVSPAAVSGAVRYLSQVHLIVRERAPGSRRDQFRLYDDVWYEAILRRDQLLARWARAARTGIGVLGNATPAGHRMAETLAFFEFVQEEIPPMLKRWRELRASVPPPPPG
jgi:hypothetical protein